MAYTFSEIQKQCPDKLLKAVINTFLEDASLLSVLPLQTWDGQKLITYLREQSLPDTDAVAWNGDINSSEGVYQRVSVELKSYVSQFDLDRMAKPLGGDHQQRILSASRSMGAKIREEIISGCSTTAGVGATIGSKGIGDCTPGARIPSGLGYLKWEKDDDKLYFKAPDDTSYGDAVTTISGVAEKVRKLTSGNSSSFIRLAVTGTTLGDESDFETSNALTGITFTSSDGIDGLYSLVEPSMEWYGNNSSTTPSSDGDAISLAGLWYLIKKVKGPNKVLVCNLRTEISIRSLIDGNATVDEFMGFKLAQSVPVFGGCPVFASDSITLDEEVGTSDDCSSVFCASLSPFEGLFGYVASPAEPGEFKALSDDSEDNLVVPVDYKSLGVLEDKNQTRHRVTSYFALALKNSLALGRLRGITD